MSCVIGCGQDFGTAKEFDSRTDKLSCVKRITDCCVEAIMGER